MSNVMFDKHSADSLGDVSHIGNVKSENRTSGSSENIANSQEYHFHSTIQHLEDGLQEQWKEQNRNMNKNRENAVSSMTDAKFRKLVTTMVFPVMYSIAIYIVAILLTPLLFAIKSDNNLFEYLGFIIGVFLFLNIFFDAYVIYRSRKYVIEKVTNKYYKILHSSWKTYEALAIFVTVIVVVFAVFFMNENYTLQTSVNMLNNIFAKIDLMIFRDVLLIVVSVYFLTYYLFVFKIGKKAIEQQRKSIIEARSSSEHNADVAEAMLSGKIGNFENEI